MKLVRALEEKRQSARRMLTRGETNLKQIAEDLNMPIEEVEAIKTSMK